LSKIKKDQRDDVGIGVFCPQPLLQAASCSLPADLDTQKAQGPAPGLNHVYPTPALSPPEFLTGADRTDSSVGL